MINVNVDLAKWSRQFAGANAIITNEMHKAFRIASTKLYTKIISYTPVGDPSLWKYPMHAGYHPGTLKKSWKIEFNQSNISIFNDQPYAERVENGWSTQAPEGMMKRALASFQDLLNAEVKL